MTYDWETSSKRVGVDDLTLIPKLKEGQIVDNLKKRLDSQIIYTYIGFVLVAVNPYKMINGLYGPEQIRRYRGRYSHELEPHIYSLADRAFRDLSSKKESQAVIVTGESGAGKTESAKLIMQYISAVSGGGSTEIDHVKRVILESNQILESFGNACTLQNNNSSRFGKYMEIQFNNYGSPIGGRISNYLLEKSRVVYQQNGERNFHIFYQLTIGSPSELKEYLGLVEPQHFNYINQGGKFSIDGMDEVEEFNKTINAMDDLGINESERNDLCRTLAVVLHLGNIDFYLDEEDNVQISDQEMTGWVASLIGTDPIALESALLYRTISVGQSGSLEDQDINIQNNINQAYYARDALAKAIYSRVFDVVVQLINRALGETHSSLVFGILDIFGFEIFKNNGFEQFCINFVNEKLQQIFIELTLKMEQEEYVAEGINWDPIDYFDNKIVCDLIESKRPPGIISILNDVCVMPSSTIITQDEMFLKKLDEQINNHKHYQLDFHRKNHFIVKHYAGDVSYNGVGFTDKNLDTLNNDLIILAQSSEFEFLASLFPETITRETRKRPTSAAQKVINSATELVEKLKTCVPHYVRCIRPNSKKKPMGFEDKLTLHQVKYLGLLENVRVRRAGFAFRQEFERFVHHYGVLCPKTWPYWSGESYDGAEILLNFIKLDFSEWQLGKTKVFIRHPESLFHVEELRERKYHDSATKIQRYYRLWKARKHYEQLKKASQNIVSGHKQRRRLSINRIFTGDYINYLTNAKLKNLMEDNNHHLEKILYANRVYRVGYSRFRRRARREDRDIIVTDKGFYLVALVAFKRKKETIKKLQITLSLSFNSIYSLKISKLADNFICIVLKNYDLLFEDDKKTELITILKSKNSEIQVEFLNSFKMREKKGKTREIIFKEDINATAVLPILKGSRKALNVGVKHGIIEEIPKVGFLIENSETKTLPQTPPRKLIEVEVEDSEITPPQLPPKRPDRIILPQLPPKRPDRIIPPQLPDRPSRPDRPPRPDRIISTTTTKNVPPLPSIPRPDIVNKPPPLPPRKFNPTSSSIAPPRRTSESMKIPENLGESNRNSRNSIRNINEQILYSLLEMDNPEDFSETSSDEPPDIAPRTRYRTNSLNKGRRSITFSALKRQIPTLPKRDYDTSKLILLKEKESTTSPEVINKTIEVNRIQMTENQQTIIKEEEIENKQINESNQEKEKEKEIVVENIISTNESNQIEKVVENKQQQEEEENVELNFQEEILKHMKENVEKEEEEDVKQTSEIKTIPIIPPRPAIPPRPNLDLRRVQTVDSLPPRVPRRDYSQKPSDGDAWDSD